MKTAVAIAVALCLPASTTVALAGPERAKAQWGGSDLGVSCETVRAYRAEIAAMPPETRSQLARSFGITRKQRRQAMACLKVN